MTEDTAEQAGDGNTAEENVGIELIAPPEFEVFNPDFFEALLDPLAALEATFNGIVEVFDVTNPLNDFVGSVSVITDIADQTIDAIIFGLDIGAEGPVGDLQFELGGGPVGVDFELFLDPNLIEGIIAEGIEDIVDIFIEELQPPPDTSSETINVSGTQTLVLKPSVSESIVGGTGNDTITLSGQAEVGDNFDGVSGTDQLILDAFANVIQVNNTDTLTLPSTSLTQTIQFGTAGSMTLSGGTTDPSAPFNIAGTGSAGDNNLNQTLTLGFQMGGSKGATSNISLSGGTDTLVLAQGTNTLNAVVGVETFQLTGSGGQTNTFTLNVALTGQTITGAASDDTINVQGLSSADTINGSTGTDVLGLSSGVTLADSIFTNVSNFQVLKLVDTAVDLTNVTTLTGFTTAKSTGTDTVFTVDAVNLAALTTFQSGGSGGKLTTADQNVILTNIAAATSGISTVESTNVGASTFTVNDTALAEFTVLIGGGTGGIIDAGADTTVDLTNQATLTDFATAKSTGTDTVFTVDAANLAALTTFQSGGSAGTIQLADGGVDASSLATATLTNITNLKGGTGADTITTGGSTNFTIIGGQGGDTLNLNNSGAHTVRYTSDLVNEAGDTLASFAQGAGSDTVDFASASLVNGTPGATLNQLTATAGVIGANDVFIELGGGNFTANDTGTAAGAATVITALDTSSILSGDKVIIGMDDGTNSYLWYFQENGTATNAAVAGELTLVATVSGLAEAAGFADGDFTFA